MTDEHSYWLGRSLWCALPKRTRRDVIKLASKGQRYPDHDVAIKALGWAWAVLGPPDRRRSVSFWQRLDFVFAVTTTTAGANLGMDIFDGSVQYDYNPMVRHVARQIERANADAG